MFRTCLVFFLSAVVAIAQETTEDPPGSLPAYLASGALTPQLCATASPRDLIGKLVSEHIYTHNGTTPYEMESEVAFSQAYAEKLRPLTDRKSPKAAEAREEWILVMNDAVDFIVALDRPRNRYRPKVPAYAEWLLYSSDPGLFEKDSRPTDSFYPAITDEDISAYIRCVTAARADLAVVGVPSELATRASKKLLESLHKFERHLGELGKAEFRRILIKFIDGRAWYL